MPSSSLNPSTFNGNVFTLFRYRARKVAIVSDSYILSCTSTSYNSGSSCLQQSLKETDTKIVVPKKMKQCDEHKHYPNFTYSARGQTRKWHLSLTLVRFQPWSLMALGNGRKILLIKDHVCSSINGFVKELEQLLMPVSW